MTSPHPRPIVIAPRVVDGGRLVAEQARQEDAQRTQQQAHPEASLTLRHGQPHAGAHDPKGQQRDPQQRRQQLLDRHRDLLSTGERRWSPRFEGESNPSLNHAITFTAMAWLGCIVLGVLVALTEGC